MRRRSVERPVVKVPVEFLADPHDDFEAWAPPEVLAEYHATKGDLDYRDPRTGSSPWMTVTTAAWHYHSLALVAWADREGLRIDKAMEAIRAARGTAP